MTPAEPDAAAGAGVGAGAAAGAGAGAGAVSRRRPNRRSHVIDAAERLFTTVGYANTSVEDIARAAGLTRPVIYQYFGSKEGLLIECVARARELLNERLALLGTAPGGAASPYEHWKSRGELYFRTVEERPALWALVYSNDTTLSGGLALEFSRLREGTILAIVDVLREDADASDEALLAQAYAISGIGEQLVRLWQRDPRIPRARLAERYAAIVTASLGALRCHPLASHSRGPSIRNLPGSGTPSSSGAQQT